MTKFLNASSILNEYIIVNLSFLGHFKSFLGHFSHFWAILSHFGAILRSKLRINSILTQNRRSRCQTALKKTTGSSTVVDSDFFSLSGNLSTVFKSYS
jgi:hypothetical protein